MVPRQFLLVPRVKPQNFTSPSVLLPPRSGSRRLRSGRATSSATCPKLYSTLSLSNSPSPLTSPLTDPVFAPVSGGGGQPPQATGANPRRRPLQPAPPLQPRALRSPLHKSCYVFARASPSRLITRWLVPCVQGVFLWGRAEAEQEGDGDEARRLRAAAAEHFLAAAKLNPNDGVPFRFLGHHYARGGDTQRAAKCYQRAVALNPDDAEAGVCVGNA